MAILVLIMSILTIVVMGKECGERWIKEVVVIEEK